MLRRSESELRNAIRTHGHLINEPNVFELRPLHISIGWSYGIKILLDHGAEIDVFDNQKLRPVDHAVFRACLPSLKLLEETNLPLHGLEVALRAKERARRIDIMDYLIDMEVNRRRKLQSLVVNVLPKSLVFDLWPVKDKLLDIYAVDAVIALQQHAVSIPASLTYDKSYRTVYHLSYLTRDVAESLWEAGFRDINQPDCSGDTPLMKNCYFRNVDDSLELMNWFKEKGVDLNETVQHIHDQAFFGQDHLVQCSCSISGHTVLHILALRLSVSTRGSRLRGKLSLNLFKQIFQNETQDACKCACSFSGCRAVFIFIKNLTQIHWGNEIPAAKMLEHRVWPSAFWLGWMINNMTSKDMIVDLIRFLTFDALDLTHTCCRSRKTWFSANLVPFENDNEIEEIHDEEHEDLQLLENLLLEFDQFRRKSNCSIQEFFFTYWRIRMKEVLSEEKTSSLDDLREVGVFLHASRRQGYQIIDLMYDMINDHVNDPTNNLSQDMINDFADIMINKSRD